MKISNLILSNYKPLKLIKINYHLNLLINRNYCSNHNNKINSNDELIKDKVKVRFAPSPTGFMHIGGVRTAFINYLFAKKYDGDFILRIEDTDQKRVVSNATENIQHVLEWFDLKPDEGPFNNGNYGPYYQSKRKDIYKKYAYQLLDQGLAYRCFCDETLLKLLRDQAKKNRNIIGYDNRCRNLTKIQIEENLSKGLPYSIRFRLTEGVIKFNDMIKDEICVNLAETEPDFVILKSDQYPTYHLANVIDDHLMKITHVIRGMEWLKSTPKHLMLYNAFNWTTPVYAHLPLIQNPSGTKLSKRNEDLNIINLKNNGIFKESILNYLVTIGGGFKTDYTKNNNKIYELDYFKKDFDETLLRPNSSKLQLKKINFYNHLTMKYLFENRPDELINKLKEFILKEFEDVNENQLNNEKMIKLIKQILSDKLHTFEEIKESYSFVWTNKIQRNNQSIKINFNIDQIKKELIELINKFDNNQLTDNNLNELKSFCKGHNLEYGPFLRLIRHSITGKISGPKIIELYTLLGKELFIKRLEDGFNYN